MDIEEFIPRIKKGDILSERELKAVCRKAIEILAEESNVVQVKAPVVVAGDIHGQFYDLLELFRIGGEIPHSNYIFIGDFVDRGAHSVETMELFLCLKVKYPSHITLLRGNHETRLTSRNYGFYDEIHNKYGNENAWNMFQEVFDYLPISAVIDDKIFCVHGGLSPDIRTIDEIRLIDRVVEAPSEGPFADLLWSDPYNLDDEGWAKNSRGAGWLFGARVVADFNHLNGLELIARAHQLVQEGYEFWFPERSLVTVWSAPNYSYKCGNQASIMLVNEYLERSFKIFKEVPESKLVTDIEHFIPYFL